MVLQEESTSGVDISSSVAVLDYAYTGTTHKVVLARISLTNIVGGGDYSCSVLLNGVEVLPSVAITIGGGVVEAEFQSRLIVLRPSDRVVVEVLGRAGDTAVDIVTTLMDATSITGDELESSLLESLETSINSTITSAIADLNVTVRPTRTVLGSCSRQVRTFAPPLPRNR